jgi:uncharacterized protein YbaR (Trm112 family)
MISEELLTILACPACRGNLELDAEGVALLCRSCNLVFPVRYGIPVLLVDQAERFS